jgi:hypothetical protein
MSLTKSYFLKISKWGAVVEEVRTIFEKRNDATIYIPDMQSIAVLA